MQYRVCPVKLVSELFNSGMFQRAGKGGKAPQRLRRLPYYALADVALAVADLHSHCSESLGKLPNILPVIKQATAEAICTSFFSLSLPTIDHLLSNLDSIIEYHTYLIFRANARVCCIMQVDCDIRKDYVRRYCQDSLLTDASDVQQHRQRASQQTTWRS